MVSKFCFLKHSVQGTSTDFKGPGLNTTCRSLCHFARGKSCALDKWSKRNSGGPSSQTFFLGSLLWVLLHEWGFGRQTLNNHTKVLQSLNLAEHYKQVWTT